MSRGASTLQTDAASGRAGTPGGAEGAPEAEGVAGVHPRWREATWGSRTRTTCKEEDLPGDVPSGAAGGTGDPPEGAGADSEAVEEADLADHHPRALREERGTWVNQSCVGAPG